MLFSVIYEFDIPMDARVKWLAPSQRHLFSLTEESNGEPSDWSDTVFDGRVKHRKYCALLTRKQFERFLQDTELYPEDVETMGSLGAPGYGCGLAPAISFTSDESRAIQSAYVTPIPEVPRKSGISDSEKNWRRVKRAILNLF